MTDHHCHAIDCNESVPPRMHMCLRHWRMVPSGVKDLIWSHYRAGQENDKRPSIEYLAVAFVSVSCVALKEGKALPMLSVLTLTEALRKSVNFTTGERIR